MYKLNNENKVTSAWESSGLQLQKIIGRERKDQVWQEVNKLLDERQLERHYKHYKTFG